MPKKGETNNPLVSQMYKTSPTTNGGQTHLPEDAKIAANQKAISFAKQFLRVPTVKDEPDAVNRMELYLDDCIAQGRRPTWESLALTLGTTRSSLWDWETGRSRGPLSSDFVKKMKEMMASIDATLVVENALNPVTYIFRSKNYYGMKDEQEMILTPRTEERKAKELMALAEELPEE